MVYNNPLITAELNLCKLHEYLGSPVTSHLLTYDSLRILGCMGLVYLPTSSITYYMLMVNDTPQETNMSPENGIFQ